MTEAWWYLCDRAPRGWWCSRPWWHAGPCAARPRWWNLPARLRGQ